jgi:hypothetical protein
MLPNVGREAHTYLTYIIDNYDRLPEYVMFCQGRIDDHVGSPGIDSYVNPDYDFVAGRFCYAKEWDDITGRLKHHGVWLEMLEQGKLRKARLSYVDWFEKVLRVPLDKGTLYSPGAIFFVSSTPRFPVQAFAFPLLQIIALIFFDGKISSFTETHAAFTRFVVKVPAELQSISL